jgi:hypothetical protein
MKKVLFYIHNGWVFGKIHNELIKTLYPDVYCDIICWTQSYKRYEFDSLKKKYDYFLSTPEGCCGLFDNYGIELERCIGVLHQDWDIYTPLRNGMPRDYINKLAGYAAICPILQNISLTHGIDRPPDILPIGILQSNYPRNKSSKPSRLGYFAKYSRIDQGFDVKRGNLAEEIATKTGLELVKNEGIHFLSAEILYEGIDILVSPSLVEGNPYPMLEAFACGIPYFGTNTGIAPEYLRHGGGKILPMKAEDFVFAACYEIEKMKGNSNYYCELAEQSYKIGKSIDWNILKNKWIDYFNSL